LDSSFVAQIFVSSAIVSVCSFVIVFLSSASSLSSELVFVFCLSLASSLTCLLEGSFSLDISLGFVLGGIFISFLLAEKKHLEC
jgi:hypothetical protein